MKSYYIDEGSSLYMSAKRYNILVNKLIINNSEN